MAEVTAQMVKELREITGAGILDCKKALSDFDGNMEEAIEALRKKGLAAAAKKATRDTNEGLIGHYIHAGSKVAGLVEVNCETDFVARTDQFQQLARDLAMQVVAARPQYVSREEVPTDILDKEREIYREQLVDSNKPPQVVEQIIEGKVNKWYSENCLLEQDFIKDPSVTIQSLLTDQIAALGENIRVNRFARLEIGG
ncbi:MAG: translation elongation factor Ts [Caldilineaceae bacterium]|nr:translation elongation factor Ts [Caldilineaceae bacterium]MCB0144915.1 translation elongation factor Ts [Caldilineaceae bacterium]